MCAKKEGSTSSKDSTSKKGFTEDEGLTLIEFLPVITIIAILMAIVRSIRTISPVRYRRIVSARLKVAQPAAIPPPSEHNRRFPHAFHENLWKPTPSDRTTVLHGCRGVAAALSADED